MTSISSPATDGEEDLPGVEEIAGRAGGRAPIVIEAAGRGTPPPDKGGRRQGGSGIGQVDPDLMRTPGRYGHFDKRGVLAGDRRRTRTCLTTAGRRGERR